MGSENTMKRTSGSINIRPLREEDIPTLQNWINDPLIMRRIGIEGERSLSMQREWFRNLEQDSTKEVWAIVLRDTGTYIGNVSLYDIDRKHCHAGLAVFIGDGKNRGKGYGSLAVRLMLKYAFTDLKLHHVYCKTETSFQNAIKMYESIGFQREGVLIEHELHDGHYVDKVIYGIHETEFEIQE